MGKKLSDYREQNEEAIKFFDGYQSPPPPKRPRTVFPALNIPIAPRLPKKVAPSPNGKRQLMKRRMYEEQKGICAYCDDPITFDEATFDHIMAKWKGGPNSRRNLVLVCYPCNSMKGDIISVAEANHRIFVFSEFIARLAQKGYLK